MNLGWLCACRGIMHSAINVACGCATHAVLHSMMQGVMSCVPHWDPPTACAPAPAPCLCLQYFGGSVAYLQFTGGNQVEGLAGLEGAQAASGTNDHIPNRVICWQPRAAPY